MKNYNRRKQIVPKWLGRVCMDGGYSFLRAHDKPIR